MSKETRGFRRSSTGNYKDRPSRHRPDSISVTDRQMSPGSRIFSSCFTDKSTMPTPSVDIDTLLQQWETLKQNKPGLRAREAAACLGISEAQLVALSCGQSATRLNEDWPSLLSRIPDIGHVMALTRNDSAVHEKKGLYIRVSSDGAHGIVTGGPIDLRYFWNAWHCGFAVRSQTRQGELISLQFFDTYGTAIHKIYLTEHSSAGAYERIVQEFTHENQSPQQYVRPEPSPGQATAPADVDVEAFRAGWTKLRDTHDFFPLIRKFNLSRRKALEYADPSQAHQVEPSGLESLLTLAAGYGVPLLVFTGNRGALQIHSGPIHTIRMMPNWLNIMDKDFTLHLHTPDIHQAWIVRKPTVGGIVTSLEVFDRSDNTIALFFSACKPGTPEQETWCDIIRSLPRLVHTA